MNKINEIIDGLIFIKGGTKDISERETINKACDILAKVERGELVEVVRCKDCISCETKKRLGNGITEPPYVVENTCVLLGLRPMQDDDFCSYGERSGENV